MHHPCTKRSPHDRNTQCIDEEMRNDQLHYFLERHHVFSTLPTMAPQPDTIHISPAASEQRPRQAPSHSKMRAGSTCTCSGVGPLLFTPISESLPHDSSSGIRHTKRPNRTECIRTISFQPVSDDMTTATTDRNIRSQGSRRMAAMRLVRLPIRSLYMYMQTSRHIAASYAISPQSEQISISDLW